MAQVRFEETSIPGLLVVEAPVTADARGSFTKTFTSAEYAAAGLAVTFDEEYHTHSRRGVLRGMHFQAPPADHEKVVFCVHGTVFDAVLDLRVGSPAFGVALTFELEGASGRGLYVPRGCAHGFAALTDDAIMSYKVNSPYDPARDSGVLWSSLGVSWPFDAPLLSPRDAAFPSLDAYDSPFTYGGDAS